MDPYNWDSSTPNIREREREREGGGTWLLRNANVLRSTFSGLEVSRTSFYFFRNVRLNSLGFAPTLRTILHQKNWLSKKYARKIWNITMRNKRKTSFRGINLNSSCFWGHQQYYVPGVYTILKRGHPVRTVTVVCLEVIRKNCWLFIKHKHCPDIIYLFIWVCDSDSWFNIGISHW